MGATATFSYSAWVARYPEFSAVSQATAEAYFAEATIYLRNDGTGPVQSETTQLALLNMLTAHIAQLYSGSSVQPLSPLVGRLSDATEGSVSVSTEMPTMPGSAAWFQQTRYGLSFWQATAPYRTMRYRAGPRRIFDPWSPRW